MVLFALLALTDGRLLIGWMTHGDQPFGVNWDVPLALALLVGAPWGASVAAARRGSRAASDGSVGLAGSTGSVGPIDPIGPDGLVAIRVRSRLFGTGLRTTADSMGYDHALESHPAHTILFPADASRSFTLPRYCGERDGAAAVTRARFTIAAGRLHYDGDVLAVPGHEYDADAGITFINRDRDVVVGR
ncbi:hypothetical protein [Bifidobacterium saguinibicoloris]|uniref:hypothetical protein n=1 Tax=Bifidobacterium saguinibicoloris TaxID=2834433 RepID=UPI001C59FD41|nr:hypothetical protein [Bifidobacterium saguinibicoloris]MBW3081743.1 hypothetical protein [Bifidobacterium saguinibicoloris]